MNFMNKALSIFYNILYHNVKQVPIKFLPNLTISFRNCREARDKNARNLNLMANLTLDFYDI